MKQPSFISLLLKLGACFGILTLLFIFSITRKIPLHNLNLWKLARNFRSVDFLSPVDSKLLLQVKDFGSFSLASNSCDYLVGEFRISRRPKGEIRQIYNNASVVSFDGVERIPVEIYFIDDEKLFEQYPWYEWREKIYHQFDSINALGNVYLISALQADYSLDSLGGDIRCH